MPAVFHPRRLGPGTSGTPTCLTRLFSPTSTMRGRINGNRERFADGLAEVGLGSRREGILRQRGMFSLLGLSDEQVARLRNDYAIYVVGGGRVNVAGLTPDTIAPVCRAIAEVIAA